MSSVNRQPQFAMKSLPRHLRQMAGMALLGGVVTGLNAVAPAQAQDAAPKRGASAILEEVMVTARKREEQSQDVPLSISAYGSSQIEALKVRDLSNLSVGMPNVALDDTGSAKGYANFSIRGLGINSSIVSIDPTVGIFVDGVYMGMTAGMVFDVFDLERIEVLRGPQGTLFGRNVTGGAILMSTKKPSDQFEATVRVAADRGTQGGLNRYIMGSVSGPLTDKLAAKISAYHNNDDGWFVNRYTAEDFGANEQTMFRTAALFRPSDSAELILRWEHASNDSDGPAGQSHTNGQGSPGKPFNWDRNSHDFAIDEEGLYNTDTDFVSFEYNQDVGFGNGTITNIFGWRDYEAKSVGDIDSQPFWIFHSDTFTEAEQYSNELRYSGRFADRASVTTGLYYFKNTVDYHERRRFGPGVYSASPVTFDGGGYYDVETWAVFGAMDYDLTDSLILNLGLRYTYEEKEAQVASLSQNSTLFGGPTCNLVDPAFGEARCDFDFEDDEDWSNWSPKVGITYLLTDTSRMYAHWTRGQRSGGYNLRNTAVPAGGIGPIPGDTLPLPYSAEDPTKTPGPFDEETVDNFEIGYKSEYGRSRFNAALFYNIIEDMQRELNFTGSLGVVQLVRNTADAAILGVEVDGAVAITESLLLTAAVGWIDAEYTDVRADLNGDGFINSKDEDLDLPRAAEWTYSVGLNHDLELGDWGYMSSRLSYAYRDESAYTDNNLGFIDDQEILDAGIDFHTADESWIIGIYGRNLLDDVKHGGDTQLPTAFGGTFAPLAKGRLYGVELTYNFK